jgi:hypothetical protein
MTILKPTLVPVFTDFMKKQNFLYIKFVISYYYNAGIVIHC